WAVKEFVPQYKCNVVGTDVVGADHERLRQPVGPILHGVADVDPERGAVAEHPVEPRCIVGLGDHLDVADPGQDQRRQRVIDERLVIHRQQLLADTHRDRIQPRARAAGEDDPAHIARPYASTRSASVSSVAASADARSRCRNTEVTLSWTTRNADADLCGEPGPKTSCSTTTTPSCTYIRPGSDVDLSDAAQSRSASWPCAAPSASPISMSSLESSASVSRS